MNERMLSPKVECEKGHLEFETLLTAFEAKHSLEKLNAIKKISVGLTIIFLYSNDLEDEVRIEKDIAILAKYGLPGSVDEYKDRIATTRASILALKPDEKIIFEIRRSAIRDLAAFDALQTSLENVPEDLKARYSLISRAVGIVELDGVIDHERGK